MPTYAQLQAESWWGREIVTPELDWLGDELCRRTKRPRTAAGTKGDNHHLSGGHRSQEWILKSRYSTSRTYTVQSGLTATQARHVAAFDFTPGSAEQMIAQCRRLIAAMKAGRLDEVLAIYGNVDGDRVVDGWDNVRNRAASSDSSHLWHWHLTLDRRHCADRKLMERILAIVLGDPVEDEMSAADVKEILDRLDAIARSVAAAGYRIESSVAGRLTHNNQIGNKAEPNRLTEALRALAAGQQAILAATDIDPAEVQRIAAAMPVPPTADEIADATVARLGGGDLDDVAAALRAAFGDRLDELVSKLSAGG